MSSRPVRVATVVPDPALRLVLGHAFSRRDDVELVIQADGSPASLDQLATTRPDVVLVDQTGDTDRGHALLAAATARCPEAMCALLASHDGPAARRSVVASAAHTSYGKTDLSLALIDRLLADHARFRAGRDDSGRPAQDR